MANFYYTYARQMEGGHDIVTLKWWQEGENPGDSCLTGGFSKPLTELDAHEQEHLNDFLNNGQILTDKSNMPEQPNGNEMV